MEREPERYPDDATTRSCSNSAYFEYRPTNNVTVFFQPSRLVNNLPSDATPQYIPTFIEGASYKFTKYTYVQVVASTGTPSNRSQLGITALTLSRSDDESAAREPGGADDRRAQGDADPTDFGIGSPSVIPL